MLKKKKFFSLLVLMPFWHRFFLHFWKLRTRFFFSSEKSTFEEVLYLLWHGELPSSDLLTEFTEDLSNHREIDPGMDKIIMELADQNENSMAALRTMISMLSGYDPHKKDTKNHPKGVWTLLPTLKLGEKNKEKYLKIGESDRMTLKFIKPKN